MEHHSRTRVVQGAVAASKDSPEGEGVPIQVGLYSESSEPQFGVGIIEISASPSVRLSVPATEVVHALLNSVFPVRRTE